MPQTSSLRDIPPDKIEALVNDHKAMGASKVEFSRQPNGMFTLKVTYPSDEEEQATNV